MKQPKSEERLNFRVGRFECLDPSSPNKNFVATLFNSPICKSVGTSPKVRAEGASETSTSSRVKTNLSTMDFYADLCFPRPGESFSVQKSCLRKKGKILRIILAEK